MEKVTVKLVVFFRSAEKTYCGYCPELRSFFRHENEQEVISYIKGNLYRELCHRLRFSILKKLGWKVSENSAIPPIFADEEALIRAKRVYKDITEPKIIEVNVELPEPKDLW